MTLRGHARGRAGPYRGSNYQGYGGRGYISSNHMVVLVDLQGNLVNTGTHQKSPEGPQLSQVRRTGHR